MTDPIDIAALRSLRDCRVVRARLFHPGYLSLARRGLATMTALPQHEDDPHPRRDFRLTDRGRIVAGAALRER